MKMYKACLIGLTFLLAITLCLCRASSNGISDAQLDQVYGSGACQDCSWVEGTDDCPTPISSCYIYDETSCWGWESGGICAEESKKCNGTAYWTCTDSTPECSSQFSLTPCAWQSEEGKKVCKKLSFGAEYYGCGGTKDWCTLSLPQ